VLALVDAFLHHNILELLSSVHEQNKHNTNLYSADGAHLVSQPLNPQLRLLQD
jgi:hypothetical protein